MSDTTQTSQHREAQTLTWTPKYRTSTCDEQVTITIDLPGVAKSDIKLNSQQQVIRVQAKRTHRVPENSENISFSKKPDLYELQLEVSKELDLDKVSAVHKLGVLTLTLPKQAAAATREISISE